MNATQYLHSLAALPLPIATGLTDLTCLAVTSQRFNYCRPTCLLDIDWECRMDWERVPEPGSDAVAEVVDESNIGDSLPRPEDPLRDSSERP